MYIIPCAFFLYTLHMQNYHYFLVALFLVQMIRLREWGGKWNNLWNAALYMYSIFASFIPLAMSLQSVKLHLDVFQAMFQSSCNMTETL